MQTLLAFYFFLYFINYYSIMGQKYIIPYSDGSIYQGQCDTTTAKPSGKGQIRFKNGWRFIGFFDRGQVINGKLVFQQENKLSGSFQGDFNHQLYNGNGVLSYYNRQIQKGIFKNGKLIQGISIYENGDIYQGICQSIDFLQGTGKYTFKQGDSIEGYFQRGNLTRNGKILFKNQDIYQGEFQVGYPNGKGKYIKLNRFIYEGNFNNGKFEGQGKIIYANNDTYIGNFSNNKKNGHGIYSYENGITYTGSFIDDQFTGWCKIQYNNQSQIQIFTGEIQNGLLQGIGQIIYKNQSIYQGQIHNNQRCGLGRLIFQQNKSQYQGYFNKKGQYQGKGKIIYQNKDTYQGEFSNNMRHGQGVYIYQLNGTRFQGNWVYNVKHGEGKVTYANGKIQIGWWVNGRRAKNLNQRLQYN